MQLKLKHLEKFTLLVDEVTTKKEKIEATIELRKCKARIQALAKP
jgi:transcription termination factor NusB